MRSGTDGLERLVQVRDLGQHTAAVGDGLHRPGRIHPEHHRMRTGRATLRAAGGRGVRQVRGGEAAARRDPHPVPPVGHPLADVLPRLEGFAARCSQVENAEAARAADRCGESGVRFPEGSDADDKIAGVHGG
ncbi:hypothetical protein ACFWMG_35255 [Streptomyces sp. NPDC127074]|uniref:hypothetical protein n=1 Tax=Streptomyces sp. NPDC127074 TaxID=3347130 RepID=UPI003655E97D